MRRFAPAKMLNQAVNRRILSIVAHRNCLARVVQSSIEVGRSEL